MDRRRDSTRILFCNISIYHNTNYIAVQNKKPIFVA
nr:MAG TPA: hypothetical protein [Caudoviricetes sp.]